MEGVLTKSDEGTMRLPSHVEVILVRLSSYSHSISGRTDGIGMGDIILPKIIMTTPIIILLVELSSCDQEKPHVQ